MSKFFVDFEFTGHIEVEAKNEEEAKEMVEEMCFEELVEHIQHFNVGKYYIEKVISQNDYGQTRKGIY